MMQLGSSANTAEKITTAPTDNLANRSLINCSAAVSQPKTKGSWWDFICFWQCSHRRRRYKPDAALLSEKQPPTETHWTKFILQRMLVRTQDGECSRYPASAAAGRVLSVRPGLRRDGD